MKKLIPFILLFIVVSTNAQTKTEKPSLNAKKVAAAIKIDGILNEPSWAEAAEATNFIEFRPTPFKPEPVGNKTVVKIMYNNDGIYFGGKCYEANTDSIAKELVGRDGFGNNDFIGVTLDTYLDKQNGFEYFVTQIGRAHV